MELKESFDSLYSPTGSLESALAILAIAAFEHRKIKIIDLVGAYLTVDVRDNTETYVKFDLQLTEILVAKFPMYAKFVADDGTFCGRLRKSLYGICQASSNLHRELKKTLVEKMGFKPNPKDPCVFNRVIDGRQTTVIVFVDDILATASNDNDLVAFTKEFKTHPDAKLPSPRDAAERKKWPTDHSNSNGMTSMIIGCNRQRGEVMLFVPNWGEDYEALRMRKEEMEVTGYGFWYIDPK